MISARTIIRALIWAGLGGILLAFPAPATAKELRRSMPFIRPLLMGDAYVAVGDEASTLFYNPAGIARIGNNSSYEILTIQVALGDILESALSDAEAVEKEYGGLTEEQFKDLLGTTLSLNAQIRLPAVTDPEHNRAWGLAVEALSFIEIERNPVLPSLHIELFQDQIVWYTFAFQPHRQFYLGFTPKGINRVGLDKVFSFGELFAAGSEISLEEHPDFKEVQEGHARARPGLDMGFIFEFPFWKNGRPRLGLSALNIGGYDNEETRITGIEFGTRPFPLAPPKGGELPQINSAGFAFSPTYSGIRYTFAFDYVDLTRTVLVGDDHLLRTRLGLEIAIGVHEDGTGLLSLLAGLNATHPSFGVISRVTIFEVGLGQYTVEQGKKPGDNPSRRIIFIFGFRF